MIHLWFLCHLNVYMCVSPAKRTLYYVMLDSGGAQNLPGGKRSRKGEIRRLKYRSNHTLTHNVGVGLLE